MSYCTGKNIEKARGKAIKMLVIEKKPVGVIADRFGVNRTTIWRWHKKWLVQNNYRILSNPNRPNRKAGSVFRWYDLKWDIPEEYFGFKFKMVQSDNDLEFARYFETRLENRGIKIRHTRLGRPNDNAHIERFNRTLQEECTGNDYLESEPLKKMDDKILSYIDFYNYHRIHLSISYRTPAEMLHMA